MENFTYHNPAKIIFGKGSQKQIGDELNNDSSVLLVYGGDFVKELGIYAELIQQFEEKNIRHYDFDKVVPNPQVEHVREAIEICRKNQVDFILAIGGGSAIDTAKAVAIGVPYTGDVWDFFTGQVAEKDLESALPIGTLLTLPSSGSEMSNAAIISNGQTKLGFEHELLIPKFSVLNPEYTLSLPEYQTFVGIADIFSHLLERYFSDTEDVNLTDFMLEGAMKSLLINAEKLKKDMQNYQNRAEIMWSATIAHNNVLDTGRVSDWGSHRIEHELSAQYNITHGEGMAIVFPAWMAYAAKEKPAKLAQLATRVFHHDPFVNTNEELALLAARSVQQFFISLGMRKNLSDFEIDDKDFQLMANRATANGNVGHYLELNADKINAVLEISLENEF